MDRLSGDQNGKNPPYDPANGRAETESSERSHNRGRASDTASKTIFCPSGEIAIEVGSGVGGVVISKRTSGGGVGKAVRPTQTIPAPAIRRTNANTEIHTSRSLRCKMLWAGSLSM